jgi:hypothetical protein
MARYKPYDLKQVTLVPVSFKDQILPGSFEYALNEIIEEHIDMTPFEARYKNDEGEQKRVRESFLDECLGMRWMR